MMTIRKMRLFSIIMILSIVLTVTSYAKSQKYDEFKFQVGFGGMVSTTNLLGIIESVELYKSVSNDSDYEYPGITEEQQEALNELNGNMQRALLVANILGGLEYGLHTRFLWNILMAEVDLMVLPFDGTYNGRVDLLLTPLIGIRAPFFIMPYLLFGVNFTFSFYPSEFSNIENWKGNWAATDNFAFRPGIAIRGGLDIKLGPIGFGIFAQWMVKDFQEFGSFYWHLMEAGNSSSDAAFKVFASQARLGASFTIYPIKI